MAKALTPEMVAERVRAERAAVILGVTVRTVQSLAKRGTIPAARVGGIWTFDETKLRAWVAQREIEQCLKAEVEDCRKGVSGAAGSSGSGRPSRVSSTAKAYAQAMSKLRNGKPSISEPA